jgi:hypothetical protein
MVARAVIQGQWTASSDRPCRASIDHKIDGSKALNIGARWLASRMMITFPSSPVSLDQALRRLHTRRPGPWFGRPRTGPIRESKRALSRQPRFMAQEASSQKSGRSWSSPLRTCVIGLISAFSSHPLPRTAPGYGRRTPLEGVSSASERSGISRIRDINIGRLQQRNPRFITDHGEPIAGLQLKTTARNQGPTPTPNQRHQRSGGKTNIPDFLSRQRRGGRTWFENQREIPVIPEEDLSQGLMTPSRDPFFLEPLLLNASRQLSEDPQMQCRVLRGAHQEEHRVHITMRG